MYIISPLCPSLLQLLHTYIYIVVVVILMCPTMVVVITIITMKLQMSDVKITRYMHMHLCAFSYVCMWWWMCVCVNLYVFLCVWVCLYASVYASVYVCLVIGYADGEQPGKRVDLLTSSDLDWYGVNCVVTRMGEVNNRTGHYTIWISAYSQWLTRVSVRDIVAIVTGVRRGDITGPWTEQ